MSTVLAGLFCVLYLTKPVHVVSPMERDENVLPLSLPVQEQMRSDEQVESGFDNLVAAPDRGLNPLQGSLPGDLGSRVDAGGGSSITFEPVSGETGFKPLVVDGPRKSLFVPVERKVPVDPEPSWDTAVAAIEVPTIENTEPTVNGGLSVEIPDAGVSELVAVFTGEKGAEGAHISSDWEMPAVRVGPFVDLLGSESEAVVRSGAQVPSASIIGEFYTREFAQSGVQPEEANELFH